MKPRVLILTPEPPEQLGGTERFARALRACLESRNYEVEVIHRGNCGLPWKQRSRTKNVAYFQDLLVGYLAGRRARQRISGKGSNVAAVISSANVGWYPLQRSVPQVHMYHGTYREQAEVIRPLISALGYLKQKWWDSMLLEKACGRHKLVLANSDQTAREVKRYFGHDSTTVWLPLDTAHFRPLDKVTCRKNLQIPQDHPVGLFVGNAHAMKGFEVIKRLMKEPLNVYWVLVLRGELPPDLRETDGLRIFHDADYALLPSLYGSADFSLSPSRYEPFGYVVAESLACGTPVIAAPGGASCLLLREPPLRELLLNDDENQESLLAAVRKLLSNPAPYREAILRDVRPRIDKLMASANWCSRFAEVTGL